MLIKTTLISAIAAIGLTGAASADGAKGPTLLTDETMGTTTAGTYIYPYSQNVAEPQYTHCVGFQEGSLCVGVNDFYQKITTGNDLTVGDGNAIISPIEFRTSYVVVDDDVYLYWARVNFGDGAVVFYEYFD